MKYTRSDWLRLRAVIETYKVLQQAEAATTGTARAAIRKALAALSRYPVAMR